MATSPKTFPRRWLRWTLIGGGVLIGLPVLAAAVFIATFDPNAYKPRIIAAVYAATGRSLTLDGSIHAKLSLWPTITVEDASFGNMPGGSQPVMAQIRRAEARLALLPLLYRRFEFGLITIEHPVILLETDATGRPNWLFRAAQPPAPDGAPPAPPPPGADALPPDIQLAGFTITDARLTYREGSTGEEQVLGIARLELHRVPGGEEMRLATHLAVAETDFRIDGRLGSLSLLFDPGTAAARQPWPVQLHVTSAALRLDIDGVLDQPLAAKGWRFVVDGVVPALREVVALAPPGTLPAWLARPPALRDLTLSLRVADLGGLLPRFDRLQVQVGRSDLGAWLPGLQVERLELHQANSEDPLSVEFLGAIGALPLRVAGTVGAPARLLVAVDPAPAAGTAGGAAPPAGMAPWPVDLELRAGTATGSLHGAIADPVGGTGADLALRLRAPDLAPLAPLAGGALPAVRDIALDAQLREDGAQPGQGIRVVALRMTSSAGDLAGDFRLLRAPRHSIAGQLRANRIDADVLLGGPDPPGAVAPAGPGARMPVARPAAPRQGQRPAGGQSPAQGGAQGGTPGGAPAAATAQPRTPPAPVPATRRLIPDVALPLQVLRDWDADIRITIAELVAEGTTLRRIGAHVQAMNGKARLDPLEATLPGGTVRGQLLADTSVTPPSLRLVARSEGVELGNLLAASGIGGASGRLAFDVDLRGHGQDLRALAASGEGHLGAAVLAGNLAPGGRALSLLGRVFPSGFDAFTAGQLEITCAVLRSRVTGGVAQVQTLLADTSYGRLAGTGRINLRDERLDLRMETDLRLPIPGANFLRLRAGIPVGGTLSAPQADLSGIAPEALAGQAGALLRTPLDLLDGLLGVFGAAPGTVPGSGGLASCATALAEPSQRRFAAPTGAAPRETGNDNAIREILRGLVVR